MPYLPLVFSEACDAHVVLRLADWIVVCIVSHGHLSETEQCIVANTLVSGWSAGTLHLRPSALQGLCPCLVGRHAAAPYDEPARAYAQIRRFEVLCADRTLTGRSTLPSTNTIQYFPCWAIAPCVEEGFVIQVVVCLRFGSAFA